MTDSRELLAGVGRDHNSGLWTPSDNGWIAGLGDPMILSSNFLMGAGIMYLEMVKMAVTSPVSKIWLPVRSPAASGLANSFAGVYTIASGTATLLAETADISTSMQGATPVTVSLTAATAVQTIGTKLYVAILVGSGTTLPTLIAAPTGQINAALTASSPYRYGSFGTGQSALPASFSVSSMGAVSQPFGVGLS